MDEVLIHVALVFIGDGIRLFSQRGMDPVRLEKTEVSKAVHIQPPFTVTYQSVCQ